MNVEEREIAIVPFHFNLFDECGQKIQPKPGHVFVIGRNAFAQVNVNVDSFLLWLAEELNVVRGLE